MEWEHKGITFTLSTEEMGELVMVSACAPMEGAFIRTRPFSAIGTSEEEALKLLKDQIKAEYKKVPEIQ
jgi:hypothetical protein